MARQVLVLAFVLFAVVGLASASAMAPEASPASGNDGSDTIGNVDGGSDESAPVGGPVPDGVFAATGTAPAPSPKSGAAVLEVSAVAGAAAAAVAAVFF